jgi:hypothetical protein
VNDHWHAIPGASVRWRFVDAGGREHARGERRVDVAPDSSRKLEDLAWAPPGSGDYELVAEVHDAKGARLSENGYRFRVE